MKILLPLIFNNVTIIYQVPVEYWRYGILLKASDVNKTKPIHKDLSEDEPADKHKKSTWSKAKTGKKSDKVEAKIGNKPRKETEQDSKQELTWAYGLVQFDDSTCVLTVDVKSRDFRYEKVLRKILLICILVLVQISSQ